MSGPFGSSQFMYATGAEEGQSLRFEDGDSAYLSRTPASSGNRKTWTWSGWVKRGNLTSYQRIFQTTSTYSDSLILYNDDTLVFWGSDASTWNLQTNAVFRDPSAWYHIVVSVDTTQATASDRMKIYVNNELQTLSTATYPSQNTDCLINNTQAHYIGTNSASSQYLDGYLANVTFIDGTALDPTSFGEYDDTLWKPKSDADITSLTFGTNGFYLNFEDSSAIGDDTSGNANDWTANNLVATDVVLDSPVSGGNFCTMSPIDKNSNLALSEGNLKAIYTGTADLYGGFSTQHMTSGKWYAEFRVDSLGGSSYPNIGITESDKTPSNHVVDIRVNVKSGATSNEGTSGTSIDTFANGDILGIAFDADNGEIYFSKNGTFGQSQDPAAGTGAIFTGLTHSAGYKWGIASFSSRHAIANFGQDSSFAGNETSQGNTDDNGVGDFYYAPPSGFLALTTGNLPAATITAPDEYFNTVLWTGDGTLPRAITGVGFQPDWVWMKNRAATYYHQTYDVVRGTGTGGGVLYTNVTDAVDDTYKLSSFDSDGVTLSTSLTNVNNSGNGIVGWFWKAGGTGVSNTDGSITSTVSANQTSGFSIITYTGDGSASASSVGHGLSQTPDMVILKDRGNAVNWFVWHNDGTTTRRFEGLNTTNASTSTVYYSADADTINWSGSTSDFNGSGKNYVMYAFHSVEGYSKIGSYTGNGSSDGVFVHCGFRPAFVMFKRTDTTGNWWMIDNKRDITNQMSNILLADSSGAEFNTGTGWPGIDYVSNGFKLRGSAGGINASGGSYIFLAFAEAPFKSANAR